VYASDFGLWDTNVGAVARHRARVGGADVKLFFNIVPESAAYLASRDLESITRTTVFATAPDAICVSGATAGSPTDADALRLVKSAAGATPVFVNTGVRAENVADQLDIADGAIVGTYFKHDGVFENRADRARVDELMTAARKFREQLA
jgi:membrane complex biogenesis BtpA family protein